MRCRDGSIVWRLRYRIVGKAGMGKGVHQRAEVSSRSMAASATIVTSNQNLEDHMAFVEGTPIQNTIHFKQSGNLGTYAFRRQAYGKAPLGGQRRGIKCKLQFYIVLRIHVGPISTTTAQTCRQHRRQTSSECLSCL